MAGSSSSHRGAPLGQHPGQRRPLPLAGRQHPHRHLGERSEAHRRHRRGRIAAVEAGPEAERPGQAQLRIEREALVGESDAGAALDLAGGGRQQAGGEPDQARLAGAVGAGDEGRPARLESEVEPLEQQPAAADAGDRAKLEQAQPGRLLDRMHVLVGEAEMVAGLVDDDVGDERLEADPGLRPFVEQGAAVEMDHRRQLARQHRRALADRPAGIEAGQLERILDPELGEHLLLGEIVDPQHDSVEMAAERLGHPGDRRLGQPLDLRRVGRKGLTLAGHPRDIEGKGGARQ